MLISFLCDFSYCIMESLINFLNSSSVMFEGIRLIDMRFWLKFLSSSVLTNLPETNAGVPQSCIFSPTIFLLLMNDSLASTRLIDILADDSTLDSSYLFSKPTSLAEAASSRVSIKRH